MQFKQIPLMVYLRFITFYWIKRNPIYEIIVINITRYILRLVTYVWVIQQYLTHSPTSLFSTQQRIIFIHQSINMDIQWWIIDCPIRILSQWTNHNAVQINVAIQSTMSCQPFQYSNSKIFNESTNKTISEMKIHLHDIRR